MFSINSKRVTYFFRLLMLLTLSLTACQPSDKGRETSDAPQVKLSAVPEKVANCEVKIREQMQKKQIALQVIPEFGEAINRANQSVLQESQISYSVSQSKQVIGSLSVSHARKTQNEKDQISYTILRHGSESKVSLQLNVVVENVRPQSDKSIEQQYLVSEDCAFKLTQTTRTDIMASGDRTYTYSRRSFYLDGESDSDTDSFTVPEGGQLYNLDVTQDDFVIPTYNVYGYIPKVGLVQLQFIKREPTKSQEFGQSLNFDEHYSLQFLAKEQVILEGELQYDPKAQLGVTEVNGVRNWRLTPEIWARSSLSGSQDLNSKIESELPNDYLKSKDSLLLVAQKAPRYEHMAAYWKSTPLGVEEKTGLLRFLLQENPTGQILDAAIPADLASNETIQTELPEIQKIADSIRQNAPADRKAQVQLILNYLKENYQYDHSMVDNNVIRPLTTQEALNRKQGVCQHYAVIFTAVARALKIPTRIIMGYLMTGKTPGAHAWNEVEISSGVWQVIEPQLSSSLDSLQPRFYFPTMRATNLEDKNTSYVSFLKEFSEMNFILRPTE